MMVFVRASLDDREIVYCCGQTSENGRFLFIFWLAREQRTGGGEHNVYP
jgi:hypothetical protein